MTKQLRVKDVCPGLPNKKPESYDATELLNGVENNTFEEGYNQALEEISNLPVTMPDLVELDKTEVARTLVENYKPNRKWIGKKLWVEPNFTELADIIVSKFATKPKYKVPSVEEIEKSLKKIKDVKLYLFGEKYIPDHKRMEIVGWINDIIIATKIIQEQFSQEKKEIDKKENITR